MRETENDLKIEKKATRAVRELNFSTLKYIFKHCYNLVLIKSRLNESAYSQNTFMNLKLGEAYYIPYEQKLLFDSEYLKKLRLFRKGYP
jgi:hypothetical protein